MEAWALKEVSAVHCRTPESPQNPYEIDSTRCSEVLGMLGEAGKGPVLHGGPWRSRGLRKNGPEQEPFGMPKKR